MKLNLGCGLDKRPDYLNVDLRPDVHPDRIADVSDLRWLPDGAAEEILARDVLEHVPRAQVPAVLREWRRVLAPGGVLHLQLPNLRYLARRYLASGNVAEFVLWIYGGQDYRENFHQSGFDARSLARALDKAGFVVAEMAEDGGANLLCRAVNPAPACSYKTSCEVTCESSCVAGVYEV